MLVASSAFVLSGECAVSLTYFFLDMLQASLGFLAGIVALRTLGRAPARWVGRRSAFD
jgi:hypothetical protein